MIAKNILVTIAGLALLGCSASDAAPIKSTTPDIKIAEVETETLDYPRPDDTRFEDVLAEYQAYNDRLDRISARLRIANAYLCEETERDPGFTVHTIKDYPENLAEMARTMLGLQGDGFYVRGVRAESSAEAAQIKAGDQLVSMNDFPMPGDGVAQDRFYDAMVRQAYAGDIARLSLKTPQGQIYQAQVKPQTACAIPAHVYFSDNINGHTDGEEILITSALMRSVSDDVNLALIIAHEMAHVIAKHNDKMPTKNLELIADRMALVMLENSGFDIDVAIDYWRDAAHPHRKAQNSRSHPGIEARYLNFNTERLRIRRQQALGQELVFMKIPTQ